MSQLAYTYEQAAELVSVSHWTIRRMVDRGELAAVKFGRCKRIPSTELQRIINQAMTKEPTECHTSAKTPRSGGSPTPIRAAKDLASLLAQPIGRKPQR